MNPDLAYWLALNEFPKFGPKAMARLLSHFDSMHDAFKADLEELITANIPEKLAREFVHFRGDISPDLTLKKMEKNNFSAVTITDEKYPKMLREIYDPPGVLYIWGQLPSHEIPHLAVVGSRKATPYGLRVAGEISKEVAESGLVIVSGLAYGVDEAAHSATVKAGGITIAVLAHGLLKLTSRGQYLAQKIVEAGGAIVSEFPLQTHAMKQYFPYRNRIISGISHGTLVVEATEKSGSLITARTAMEQNREVFAVPGSIHSESSVGTNNLIKMGAHPVTNSTDILNVLETGNVREPQTKKIKPDSKEEALILELLSKAPIHIDEIIRSTQLNSQKVASTLSLMEMKGRTRQIGGMYYVSA